MCIYISKFWVYLNLSLGFARLLTCRIKIIYFILFSTFLYHTFKEHSTLYMIICVFVQQCSCQRSFTVNISNKFVAILWEFSSGLALS